MSRRRKPPKKPLAALIAALIIALSGGAVYLFPSLDLDGALDVGPVVEGEADMRLHVIDVGQGDGMLLESDGHYMLIDAGTEDGGKAVLEYLDFLGVEKLDIAAATHPHSDHIGGMSQVLNRYETGLFIMPRVLHTTQSFEDLLLTVERSGCQAEYALAGSRYTLGSATVEVLSPPEDFEDEELNNYSLVMRVTCGGLSLLLTGDSEAKIESMLLSSGQDLRADVLKAGHHGSDGSNTSGFLSAVSPSVIAVSCGAGNSYGHPGSQMLARAEAIGAEVFRTDLSGNIVISFLEGEIDVQCEK